MDPEEAKDSFIEESGRLRAARDEKKENAVRRRGRRVAGCGNLGRVLLLGLCGALCFLIGVPFLRDVHHSRAREFHN